MMGKIVCYGYSRPTLDDCVYYLGGLSTDTKPTKHGSENIGEGSLFLELDTGDFYFCEQAGGTSETVYDEATITTEDWHELGNGYVKYPMDPLSQGLPESIKVEWDGNVYNLSLQEGGLDYGFYGASMVSQDEVDWSEYSFGIYMNDLDRKYLIFISKDNNEHSYKIYTESETSAVWSKVGA